MTAEIEVWELRNATRQGRNNKTTGKNQLPVIEYIMPEYEKELQQR